MIKNSITKPLQALEKHILDSFGKIEVWIREQHHLASPAFYSSTDLRNSGYKIAPVDTNLFPGGFNNIAVENYPLAAEAIRRQLHHLCPNAKSLLLIPENHTRNEAYLDNVAVLLHLLEMAGIHVKLGRLDGDTTVQTSPNGRQLCPITITRDQNRLRCGDFLPCGVLLNNDLSSGLPELLMDLEIPVLPPQSLGWATRKKSDHFYQYQRVADKFAHLLQVDPWLFLADFSVCPQVDFLQRQGLECLATAVDETLSTIQEKYKQHGIDDKPFVIVKANGGTYGMGVMKISQAKDIFALNRDQRKKMAVSKGGIKVKDILIQEGVRTDDFYDAAAAEPVVYIMGGTVIGGFYRVNASRGDSDNLNASGMSFTPLPFETNCAPPAAFSEGNVAAARLYVYSVIARLADIAAAYEIKASENQNGTSVY